MKNQKNPINEYNLHVNEKKWTKKTQILLQWGGEEKKKILPPGSQISTKN